MYIFYQQYYFALQNNFSRSIKYVLVHTIFRNEKIKAERYQKKDAANVYSPEESGAF